MKRPGLPSKGGGIVCPRGRQIAIPIAERSRRPLAACQAGEVLDGHDRAAGCIIGARASVRLTRARKGVRNAVRTIRSVNPDWSGQS